MKVGTKIVLTAPPLVQNSFGRAINPKYLLRIVPTAASQGTAGLGLGSPDALLAPSTEPAPVSSRPYLFVIPLFDGTSTELGTFFERNIAYLDDASAEDICFLDLGNPEESGPGFKALRDFALREHDERQADRWLHEISRRSELSLRLERMKELHDRLSLPLDVVPGIAFLTYPLWDSPLVAPIRRQWFGPPADARPFLLSLMRLCKDIIAQDYVGRGLTNQDLRHGLGLRWAQLLEDTDMAVRGAILDQRCYLHPPAGPQYEIYTQEPPSIVDEMKYLEIVTRRDSYEFFLDVKTNTCWSRGRNSVPKSADLTPGEARMLSEYVRKRRPMRPDHTEQGELCASADAARQMFKVARAKVDHDIEPAGGGSVWFDCHAGSIAAETTYTFRTGERSFCLIHPRSPDGSLSK